MDRLRNSFVIVALMLFAQAAVAGGEGEAAADAAQAPAAPEAQSAVADAAAARYLPFSEAAFSDAADTKRVYFFFAAWCPTCRRADRAFEQALDRIPADVTLFRIDYDTNVALRREFGVTYQHTFVLVDADGELVRSWSWGDVDRLIANTRDGA